MMISSENLSIMIILIFITMSTCHYNCSDSGPLPLALRNSTPKLAVAAGKDFSLFVKKGMFLGFWCHRWFLMVREQGAPNEWHWINYLSSVDKRRRKNARRKWFKLCWREFRKSWQPLSGCNRTVPTRSINLRFRRKTTDSIFTPKEQSWISQAWSIALISWSSNQIAAILPVPSNHDNLSIGFITRL